MASRKPLCLREVTIIRWLRKFTDLLVTTIATVVDRNKTSVYKALSKGWSENRRGRLPALTSKDVTHLVRTLKRMQQEVCAKREVTLATLKKKAKRTACGKAIRKALQSRNIRFRKMRSKPILTKADKAARFKFAVLGGVGKGSTPLWRVIDKKWAGSTAAVCYEDPALKALRRTWLGKRAFRVLEDNNLTGFKSRRGEAAKRAAGIRSPFLSGARA